MIHDPWTWVARVRSRLRPAVPAAAISLGAWLALPAPAEAHPHVWIEARATLVYAGDKPVAVRHAWTFDPAYSAFLTLGAPRDAQGNVPAAALEAAAQKAVSSLADSEYFTEVRGEAGRKANGEPSNPRMAAAGDRATLSFDLPVSDRHGPTGDMPPGQARLEVMDPSYFVSFTFAEGEPVRLEGAPAGCTVAVHRPTGFSAADAAALAANVLTALSGADAADRIGNWATVTCPPPPAPG